MIHESQSVQLVSRFGQDIATGGTESIEACYEACLQNSILLCKMADRVREVCGLLIRSRDRMIPIAAPAEASLDATRQY